MKKRAVSSLLAVMMAVSMLTGCGGDSAKEESSANSGNEELTEASKEEKAGSKLDETDGRFATANDKWDGYLVDENGVKIRAGMTINELVESGYLVAPYRFSDDVDVINKAVTDMAIAPFTGRKIDGEVLSIWFKNDDGGWSNSGFSEDAWYYNPYPYAVPFGQCVVSTVIGSTNYLEDDWDIDANGDGKIDHDEMLSLYDIAPFLTGTDYGEENVGYVYPYEDYVVDFDFHEGHLMRTVQEMCYGVHWYSEDFEKENFSKYDNRLKSYEDKSESLDTSLESYTFKMGLKDYTIDLSYFDSIESISRSYVTESDYTESLEIRGITTDGDDITVHLAAEGPDFYYKDMESLFDDSKTTSSGETIYYDYGGIANFKIENGNIQLGISINEKDNADHDLEIKQKVENLLSVASSTETE